MTDATPSPSSDRRRRALLAGAFLLLLVPLFLAVPSDLRQDELIGPLGDRYHVALFLVLVVLLERHGPLRGRPRLVIGACLALGGATELLQLLAGRSATLWDWYQDALGVGFGACWIWWRRTRRPGPPLAAALVLVALVAWPLRHLPVTVPEARAAQARFPLLDDFERPHALALWGGLNGGEIALATAAGHGQVIEMTSDDDHRWPGVESLKLPWNWTGQDTLRVDCRLRDPSPQTLWFSVWIEDRAGAHDSDYALVGCEVGHQWRTVTVPLATVRTRRQDRNLALREIRAVAFFVSRGEAGPVSFQLDNLRLGGG